VLPFNRFRTPAGQGVDPLLGPEMKSTGEVMGIDASFGPAFAKSQAASYGSLPTSGRVFVSVADRDKRAMVFPVRRLADLGFEVLATAGTADVLRRHGIATTVVRKHFEGGETVIDLIMDGRIDMIVNTPYGNSGPRIDGYEIRSAAVIRGIPCITTVQAAAAAVQGIEAATAGGIGVRSLQDMHAALKKAALGRAALGRAALGRAALARAALEKAQP
jgi:carbamoyl-phosphate synthase large subunit